MAKQNVSVFMNIAILMTISLILVITGLMLFGSGKAFQKNAYAETYFDKSVQGLDVGAAVKFRGVQIGTVSDITFTESIYKEMMESDATPEQYEMLHYIHVTLKINLDKNPHFSHDGLRKRVANGLYARMQSQGITGVVFIDLDYDETQEQVEGLPYFWEPKSVYIPSQPSQVEDVLASIANFSKKLADDFDVKGFSDGLIETLTQTNILLAQVDANSFSQQTRSILANMDVFFGNMAIITTELEREALPLALSTLVHDISKFAKQLQSDTPQLVRATDELFSSITESLGQLDEKGTLEELTTTLQLLNSFIVSNDDQVSDAITALERMAIQLDAFIVELRREPDSLIFGKQGEE